jgi:hypothetical protein
VVEAAEVLGTRMRAERGIQESVRSFYKQLGDLSVFRCDVNPQTKAALYMPTKGVKLSIETVNMLIQRGAIKQKHLRALRPWRCVFVGWGFEQPLSSSQWRTTSAPCCVVYRTQSLFAVSDGSKIFGAAFAAVSGALPRERAFL